MSDDKCSHGPEVYCKTCQPERWAREEQGIYDYPPGIHDSPLGNSGAPLAGMSTAQVVENLKSWGTAATELENQPEVKLDGKLMITESAVFEKTETGKQLEVLGMDGVYTYYPVGPRCGWKIDPTTHTLIVGQGWDRVNVPLINVRHYGVVPVGPRK